MHIYAPNLNLETTVSSASNYKFKKTLYFRHELPLGTLNRTRGIIRHNKWELYISTPLPSFQRSCGSVADRTVENSHSAESCCARCRFCRHDAVVASSSASSSVRHYVISVLGLHDISSPMLLAGSTVSCQYAAGFIGTAISLWEWLPPQPSTGCRHDVQTTAAVFYLSSSGSSSRSSLYSRQAGFSGFRCHRLEQPASPHRIYAVTRGFQTTSQDLSVFPFLPRHYHMTHVLLLPVITTAWTLDVVFAIINII